MADRIVRVVEGRTIVVAGAGAIAESAAAVQAAAAEATAAAAALAGTVSDVATIKQQVADILQYGLPLPFWLQVLRLAQRDGWRAVWDVSNPNTRTLREGPSDYYMVPVTDVNDGSTYRYRTAFLSQFVAAISDGLGNLPAAVQVTEARQPTFDTDFFGGADAFATNRDVASALATPAINPFIGRPYFIMALAMYRRAKTLTSSRCLFDGVQSTRRPQVRTNSGSQTFEAAGGAAGIPIDNGVHTFGVMVNNNDTTDFYVDGVKTGTSSYATGFDGITLGNSYNYTSSNLSWSVGIGAHLFFQGTPSAEVIARMNTLLRTRQPINNVILG